MLIAVVVVILAHDLLLSLIDDKTGLLLLPPIFNTRHLVEYGDISNILAVIEHNLTVKS